MHAAPSALRPAASSGPTSHGSLAIALGVVMSGILVVGCMGGPSSPPAASPSASPSASQAGPFTFTVEPTMPVGRTIGGQRVVFLVVVDGAASDGPVDVTAKAPGATVSIEPRPLVPGTVGEVTVTPGAVTSDGPLDVTIVATRGSTERIEHRTLDMAPGEDTLRPDADVHLAPFLTWLATERPEIGISDQTAWDATPGSWVLVVSHYLYFSDEWEVGLDWHVMVAPDDWTRIYLRERWTEVRPSMAFEIPSFAGGLEPREIAPPERVWC